MHKNILDLLVEYGIWNYYARKHNCNLIVKRDKDKECGYIVNAPWGKLKFNSDNHIIRWLWEQIYVSQIRFSILGLEQYDRIDLYKSGFKIVETDKTTLFYPWMKENLVKHTKKLISFLSWSMWEQDQSITDIPIRCHWFSTTDTCDTCRDNVKK